MKAASIKYRNLVVGWLISLILTVQSVNADYFRFWRGYQKEGIKSETFQDLLNGKLIPETIKLSDSSAKLTGYAPVYVPESISRQYGLPIEFALVTYEEESLYKAYRETQAGKDYGNLHWELFDKATSKSLVPELLSGQGLELNVPEHAYFASGKATGTDKWANFSRVSIIHLDDEQRRYAFESDLVDHVKRVQAIGPSLYVVLREANNVFEYVSFENKSGLHEYLTTIRTHIDPDMGIVDEVIDAFIEISGHPIFSAPLKARRTLKQGQGLVFANQN